MIRRIVFAAFLSGAAYIVSAQTLFTYGNESVSVQEFLKAYRKNNTDPKGKQSLSTYLDLYIASRLKIKEAKARGYDTLPQLVADLENLRNQVMPSYLNDAAGTKRLIDEAFLRSQKDLHIAHIFISNTQSGLPDTAIAYDKAKAAYAKLQKGASFAEVAKEFSDDPSAQANGGDLGFITAFVLPYELENLAYNTPVGKLSPIYHSKAGYHIFKNLEERKALGRIKASQILLAFPPGADDAVKEAIKKRADSLYDRLQKGDVFGALATKFSNDVISANADGLMPEFGIGQYDPIFERTVYSLKDGEISKPFLTAHGYHIVKRLERVPVNTNKNDTRAMQALKDRVQADERIKSTQRELAQKILKEAQFKKVPFNASELYAYTDSILDYKKPAVPIHISRTSALYKLGDRLINAQDWISFAQTFRYKSDGSGLKNQSELWDEFVQNTAIDYYKRHLEEYNEDFRQQMKEFKDGNLFFEIMQRDIWGPAQSDSAGLVKYYRQHKEKYNWKQSADAVLFYINDASVARKFSEALKKAPQNWKSIVADMSEKVAADSGRFELTQIPNAASVSLKEGTITEPVVNKADNTASMALILNTHPKGSSRSFAEAKGLVINDYQNELEKRWVASLKKKYPVSINQKALAGLKK
jgi:peptidyl-prolyl cis-trans isomerase SurA